MEFYFYCYKNIWVERKSNRDNRNENMTGDRNAPFAAFIFSKMHFAMNFQISYKFCR